MKKIGLILLGVTIIGFTACKEFGKNENKVDHLGGEELKKVAEDSTNFTTIEWLDSTTQHLGNLVKNKEIEITWRFKNTGDKMLVIQSVSAGCGCTIPETPKEPFAPGQEGVIRAKYNGSGSGTIFKNVTVTANTFKSKIHNLAFTGETIENK